MPNIHLKPDDLSPEELQKCCKTYEKALRKLMFSTVAGLFFLFIGLRISAFCLAPAFFFIAQAWYRSISITCPVCGYATVTKRAKGMFGLLFSLCPRCGFSIAKYYKKSRFH